MNTALRKLTSGFVGIVAGVMLGPLFVPNPTGLLAFVAALAVALVVGGSVYRSGWLAE